MEADGKRSGKRAARPLNKPGPKPKPGGPLKIRLTIKGTESWDDWYRRYAEFKGLTPTDLFDLAVNQLAKRDKFEAPPDRV